MVCKYTNMEIQGIKRMILFIVQVLGNVKITVFAHGLLIPCVFSHLHFDGFISIFQYTKVHTYIHA